MDKTTSASSPRFNYIRDVELVAAWRRQQSGIPLGIRNRPDFKINYTELGGESAV